MYWTVFSFFTALLLNQGKIGLGLKVQCAALIPTCYCQIAHMHQWVCLEKLIRFFFFLKKHKNQKKNQKPLKHFCFLLQRGFSLFNLTTFYWYIRIIVDFPRLCNTANNCCQWFNHTLWVMELWTHKALICAWVWKKPAWDNQKKWRGEEYFFHPNTLFQQEIQ